MNNSILFLFCLAFAIRAGATESMARPVTLIPPVKGIPPLVNARYGIMDNHRPAIVRGQADFILSNGDGISEKQIMYAAIKFHKLKEKAEDSLREKRKKYITRNGGYDKITFKQGNLYAIEREYGLGGFFAEKALYIPEMECDFDAELMSVSIDNNMPVVLLDGEQAFVAVAYSDTEMLLAEMAIITHAKRLPSFYSRMMNLRKKKHLEDWQKRRLDELEEAWRTGDYETDAADVTFCPISMDKTPNRPYYVRKPFGDFKGRMLLFGRPKAEVQKLLNGSWTTVVNPLYWLMDKQKTEGK